MPDQTTPRGLGDNAQPNRPGYFGAFGGKYVAETLMPALNELERVFNEAEADADFTLGALNPAAKPYAPNNLSPKP